ncbi:MAG TPA: ATP-binding cassette domain-containing protein, partial [Polyangiaceae bacterium]|nr:ATP-binding cassette domain-containing protein [Polyangiaceae bacterium]
MHGSRPHVRAAGLRKSYRIRQRPPGAWGALKGLVQPSHRTVQALEDVSFTIAHGELLGFIGPNGAGKSTTLKILAGIMRPDGGECTVDGLTPWQERIAHVARIGVVFGQRTQLFWDLPVRDGFDLLRAIYRVPKQPYLRTRDELVALFGLEPLLAQPVRLLS